MVCYSNNEDNYVIELERNLDGCILRIEQLEQHIRDITDKRVKDLQSQNETLRAFNKVQLELISAHKTIISMGTPH